MTSRNNRKDSLPPLKGRPIPDDNDADVEPDIWVKPISDGNRTQQREQYYKQKQFGDTSDIDGMLKGMKATIVRQETIIPKGDYETYDAETWKAMNDKNSLYNRRSGNSIRWH
jgi:hypothetical protein